MLHNICFNERQNIWTTKYDWVPIVSENINDEFYSLSTDLSKDNPTCYDIWHHSSDAGYQEHVSNWYNGKQGFEFEFVVSDPIGINKIFDNLQIISNNVQPDEMEISIIGDDYMFNRKNITAEDVEEIREEYNHNSQTTADIHDDKTPINTDKRNPKGFYHFDWRLNQSLLTKWQPFKDVYKFGRRIGNIQYKDGSWFAQIEPFLINSRKEARIKDKWAKIRIRYSGKDLAIITAIKTLINI